MNQTRKIKVLEAIRQGEVGGGETHILNLVENLDVSIFEPIVLSFTTGQMIDSLNEMGVKNFVIPSTKAFDFSKWKQVKKLMQQEQIDIVHVHGTRANTNVYWAAKSLKLPVIYTIHGWSFHDEQSFFVKKGRMFFEKFFTKNSNQNISVSASNQQTGKSEIKGFESVVINNGIDLQTFNPANNFKNIKKELGIDESKYVVGFAGRITEQKEPLTLIRAFAKVVEENKNVVLLLVGEGNLKDKAIQLIKELGIDNSIVFETFRNDVPDLLNAMDIFCLPSLWEGLPIALLEAMAMRKAVVATAVDGTKEIIANNKNGIIVPAQNAEALANAILSLIKNDTLRKQLGDNARKTVESDFGVKQMTQEVEDVYLDMLNLNRAIMKNENSFYEYDRIADRKRVDFITNVLQQSLPPHGKILDVGCGNGVISRHLGRAGFNVLGVDVSEKTIESAKANTTNLPNVNFMKKSAEELVASGEKYDAIICSEVLEHLSDPGSLVSVLRESLADNGKLIVTVPNGKGPRETFVTKPVLNMRSKNNWLWKLVSKTKKSMGYSGTTVQSSADNLDHIQFFSKKDLEKLSSSYQFKITKFGKANFIEDVFPFSFFAKRITFLQKMDCKIADILPTTFTGGFFTVWEKE
jgi:glycosyltransferase involved in cell wall biosynthesis/2-polyprenyl-3-methyl-5-hydroxy-6-metoxy-1,4-benzoquinol methylase